jgi:hypothetical protein
MKNKVTPARRKTARKRTAGERCPVSPGSVVCAATNPSQWITLYEDGRVRVHVRNLSGSGRPFRTLDYRPKLRRDREAIRRLVAHLNLVAAGLEGVECEVCDCYSANDLR